MKLFYLIAVTATVILLSCESKNNSAEKNLQVAEVAILDKKAEPEYRTDQIGYIADSTNPQKPEEERKQKQVPTTQPAPKPDWDKKIIKTASLNFELKDYNKYSSLLRDKVKSVGGYIAQEDQSQSEYKIENTVTIKIPVDQFDNAIAVLTASVDKLNEKKISSQDVTAEFVDTRSRMEAKKQVRLRYMDLLKQAKNMEEILNVQSEINGIQEEIESAAGRIQYLGHSSSFSTINMTYYQVLNETAKDDNKLTLGTKIGAAFKTGLSGVGELFVIIVSIWPLLLIAFAGFFFFKRSFKTKAKEA